MNSYILYGAVVTAGGSLIALVINIIVGDKQRRRAKILEIALLRCDEQISKFYAPLINLVEQLDQTDDMKKSMVQQDGRHVREIESLTYKKYFVPIHHKIAEVFENHMHLVEQNKIPLSFTAYYRHVASERVVFSLIENFAKVKQEGSLPEDALNITCVPYPYPEPSFKNDIEAGLKAVLDRQERMLNLLDLEIARLTKPSNQALDQKENRRTASISSESILSA